MLNLLIISNSHKAQYIKKMLQPVLKVIIDVVPDFDHGLKDVFEKRPATVCIQEQISGVTGESVARHIQMLLGTGSPKFILMHEGNSKAKIIKGLFEYVIDLNLPDATLARDFHDTLKSLLGDQWDKIYIQPKASAALINSTETSIDKSHTDADKLVDDFLSDLENNSYPVHEVSPESEAIEQNLTVLNSSDEIAEMLIAQAANAQNFTKNEVNPLDDVTLPSCFEDLATGDAIPALKSEVANVLQTAQKPINPQTLQFEKNNDDAQQISNTSASDANPTDDLKSPLNIVKPIEKFPNTTVKSDILSTQVAPSEFRIKTENKTPEEIIPEELLLAFEENYRTESTFFKRNILAVSALFVVIAVSGWYMLKQHPQLLTSLKQRLSSSAKPTILKQPSSVTQSSQSNQTVPPVVPTVSPALPKFIPQHGHDAKYATVNPGWERYVDENFDIRIFKDRGSIRAVQVLSVKGKMISDHQLRSALSDLTGTTDYKIESQKNKSGLLELRGTIGKKADIIIYKNKESVRAFVVSLN